MKSTIRRLSPLIPYFAVGVGMYGCRSAWAALGLYHALMLSALIFGKRTSQGEVKRRIGLGWLLSTPIVFAAGGILLYYLWPYLNPDSQMIANRLHGFGVDKHNWPCFALYFCVVNSAIEEFFWRGYLGSVSRGLCMNDICFGGYHSLVAFAFTEPVWLVPVFIVCAFAGWLWRLLRVLTGGLAIPLATHFVADASIAIAVYLRVFA